MKDPIRVEIPGYPCPCPGGIHAVEWVDLEPEVTIPMGMAAMYTVLAMIEDATEADLRGALAPILMRFGIRTWSFRELAGLQGHVVKVTPESVERLLPFTTAGFEVADKCMDLYLAGIIAPLVARRDRLLGTGQTEPLISPNPDTGPTPPKQSPPSSHKPMAGKPSEAPV